MRLTPKQAEAVASLITQNPGDAVTIAGPVAGHGRDVIVTIDGNEFTIGGRGKVTPVE